MPTFLESIFGRKRPTSTGAKAELEKFECELAAASSRIERAKAALNFVADMTDAEHEAAIAELGRAERSQARLKEQVDKLREAARDAEKAEGAAKLRARIATNEKALRIDYQKLIADYEAKAKDLASVAESIRQIDAETASINDAIRAARRADPNADHPEDVKSSTELFRSEPDIIEPDREVSYDQAFYEGRPTSGAVFEERNGKRVPTASGVQVRRMIRVEPGVRKKGKFLPPPTATLFIPAARLGALPFWPRAR